MSAPVETDILDLAGRARELADSAPSGSLRQAAAGSVAVACATTRSVLEARQTLDGVAPKDVRDAALELLDQLLGCGPVLRSSGRG